MTSRRFPFLTNHGLVLSYLASRPRSTTRQIADAVAITERTAYAIISDLVQEGYISRRRVGRQNVYRLRPRFLRSDEPEREAAVSGLVRALGHARPGEHDGAPHRHTPPVSGAAASSSRS